MPWKKSPAPGWSAAYPAGTTNGGTVGLVTGHSEVDCPVTWTGFAMEPSTVIISATPHPVQIVLIGFLPTFWAFLSAKLRVGHLVAPPLEAAMRWKPPLGPMLWTGLMALLLVTDQIETTFRRDVVGSVLVMITLMAIADWYRGQRFNWKALRATLWALPIASSVAHYLHNLETTPAGADAAGVIVAMMLVVMSAYTIAREWFHLDRDPHDDHSPYQPTYPGLATIRVLF